MVSKKWLSVTLLLAMSFSILTGCTGNTRMKNETSEYTQAQKTPGETELLNGVAAPVSAVHWDKALQTVDGFGGSGAFGKGGSIMRLKEPVRTQILDLIFSQEKGIGLSILRNIVGDSSQGKDHIIEPEKGVFVWDDPAWETKKADFEKEQIWLMNEAKKRGVTTFISTVWSPPAWMKTNNSYTGNKSGRLKPECYQDFADYLAEYVLGYKKHFDIDISYISVANEPNYAPDYAGCLWTAEELNIFIRDYLAPTFKTREVKAKIVMPEHMNFNETLALSALKDPVTVDYIDVVATHAYGIGSNVPKLPVSMEKGKKIWQTEYMNQGEKLQTFQNNTITDALRHANLMGNMFLNTCINAYFWWWSAASNNADGSDLIRLCTTGSGNSSTENGQFRIFKRFYAFGNYSRFIRPGYVMLDTDKNPAKDTLITAFKDPKTGNFAIIAINNSPEPRMAKFDLQGFPTGIGTVVPYRTSPSENLKKLADISVNNGVFAMNLRGSSITTFIPKSFELKALTEIKDVFSTYEAEENDGQSKGLKVADCSDGGKMITDISNNSYIQYKNVNFGDGTANGINSKQFILSMNARVASLSGGTIEVKLDDPVKGKVVGTMKVAPKNDLSEWITVPTMIDTERINGAYGFHDFYLVFTGGKNGSMFNINYFNFSDGI